MSKISKETFLSITNEVLVYIVKTAYDNGVLKKEELSFVPELLIDAEPVCHKLFDNIREEMSKEGMDIKPGSFEDTVGHFCLCAGMGAVVHWNKDSQLLKKQGIYNTLTKPRGLFYMDEYVYDIVGMKFDSVKCKEFIKKTSVLFPITLADTFKRVQKISDDKDTIRQIFPHIMTNAFITMFRLGMAIQLQSIFNSGVEKESAPESPKQNTINFHHMLYKYIKDAINKKSGTYEYSLDLYTDDFVNYLFKGFSNLSIGDEYTLGTFEYLSYYLPADKKPSYSYIDRSERRIYVHRKDAQYKYLPKLKRTFVQKLLNRIPEEKHFIYTKFYDSMTIDCRLCTEECVKSIPSPLSYVKCMLNEISAWEFFLFDMLIRKDWYPIVFSYQDAKNRLGCYVNSDGVFNISESDLLGLKQYKFYPEININDNDVIIECVRERPFGLFKEIIKLEYKGNTFVIVDVKNTPLLNLNMKEGVNPIHIHFKLYPYNL